MRFMLGVSVWCFNVFFGLRMRKQLQLRYVTLQRLARFFETVRLRMAYDALPLLALFEDAGGDLPFLERCCALVREGESLESAWTNSIRAAALPMDGEALEALCMLGAVLGTTDLDGQLQILRRAADTMDSFASRARLRYEKYAPVSTSFGFFAGFAFFVFMI